MCKCKKKNKLFAIWISNDMKCFQYTFYKNSNASWVILCQLTRKRKKLSRPVLDSRETLLKEVIVAADYESEVFFFFDMSDPFYFQTFSKIRLLFIIRSQRTFWVTSHKGMSSHIFGKPINSEHFCGHSLRRYKMQLFVDLPIFLKPNFQHVEP